MDFPFKLDSELGEIRFFSQECPGVFFLTCSPQAGSNILHEFYLVEDSAPMISHTVKQMGRRLANSPHLLAYSVQDLSGGQKLVEYEVSKFRVRNGLDLPDGTTLHSIAVDGMEANPEYFGTYPVPSRTPWGHTLRYKAIDNGVYWIETEQCRYILAICYPLYDELSQSAQTLAVQEWRDQNEGLDNTMGYIFFSEESSCIPVFELMQVRRHWEASGAIKRRALENAIWRYYPEYAAEYNMQEATGRHDYTGLLLHSLAQQVPLTGTAEHMIAISAEEDVRFCTLME